MRGPNGVRHPSGMARIFSLTLGAGLLLCASCSWGGSDSTDEMGTASGAWYNQPVLRSVWGDFERSEPLEITDEAQRTALRERGEYLVRSVAACGACHGATAGDPEAPLTGGRLMRDRWGEVRAPNITPDPETGIGSWNFIEIMRALRAAIDREGRPISIDMHADYRWLADRDAKAIAVYLQSLPPVTNPVERRRLGGFERNRWMLFSRHSDVAGYIPALPEIESPHYGRYLAHSVAGCRNCHTPGGGAGVSDAPYSGGSVDPGGISFVGAVQRLVSLFIPDKGEAATDVVPYLSEKARQDLQLDTSDTGTVATVRRTEAIDEGRFPIGGPDIRGKSGAILKDWTPEQIIHYLETGTTPQGESADGRLCPWPFYSSMTNREQRAIALYLKTL